MTWVVDVDVRAGAWVRRLHLLVARSVITTGERRMHRVLHDAITNIVLLFLVIVCAGAGNFSERLPRVRCLTLMLPELAARRLREKRLRLLTNELSICGLLDVLVRRLLNGHSRLVVAWAWSPRLNLGVLAVRHLRLEHFVLTGSIESLLTFLFPVVDTWTRVVSPRLVVVGHVGLLPQLTLLFTQMELVLRV